MADDDFFEDEETEAPAVADNKDAIITRLQKKAEKLEAKIEAARKEAFEEATKSFERRGKALEVGGGLGLRPRAIETFLKENPEADITPEAITPWAEEYGFPVTTTESEEAPAEKAPPAAAAFHAGAGTPSGGETYSADEVRKIGLRDQAEALKIIADGRMRTDT